MMGSPRPAAAAEMALDEMDDANQRGSSGKIRQYPKHRAQHMAAAAPYYSPRTSYQWNQPQQQDGRYQQHGGGENNNVQPRDVTGRRVYVGNLSWEVKWMNLKDHMRQAGEVDHCDVLVEPSGRSKGCGLVTYRTAEMAREAIRTLTDTELMGRKIFVREDREDAHPPKEPSYHSHHAPPPSSHVPPPTGPLRTSRVYVSNLSWSVKWQELKDFMKQAGPVLHADVLEEPGGRSKGCGIVEYDSPETAERAIQMLNDTQFGDRKIFIREDREIRGRPPPGLHRPPRRGYDGPPPSHRGYDNGPRGFDNAPPRGFDNAPRGFDNAPRGFDNGPRGFDNAPRGFDNGPRGFDNARGFDNPSHGYDNPLPRGYDAYDAPPPTLPRGYDAYDPSGAPPPSRGVAYDQPQRGFDAPPRHGFNSEPQQPNSYPPPLSGSKLFVGNIPFDASWQDVKDLFRSVCNIDRVEVMTTADGRSKGYALVQCSSIPDAQAAIARLHDSDFRGRFLEVRLDRPRFG